MSKLCERKLNSCLFAYCLALLGVTVYIGCGDVMVEVTKYDPYRAYNGYTYFQSRSHEAIVCVNMEGDIVWYLKTYQNLLPGDMSGFDYLDDGTVLFHHQGSRKIVDPSTDTLLYEDDPIGGHHDLTMTPMQTILFLALEMFTVDYDPWKPNNRLMGDIIKEIDVVTKQIVWQWRLRDYVDPIEHHHESIYYTVHSNGARDWSHGNTVQFIPNYLYQGQSYDAVLYNSRNLNTFWVIDHTTGDILWSCGEHGMFGATAPPLLFSHAHEVVLMDNGNVMMYDNGNDRYPMYSRALELSVDPIAQVASEAWYWKEPYMYDWWGGDADRLPNGNVILVNSTRGRIIEVTSSGEKVWEMRMINPFYNTIYKCERTPYEGICTDLDGDGYSVEGDDCGAVDCDDAHAAVNPGASEICDDGLDNDCDSLVDSLDPGCF